MARNDSSEPQPFLKTTLAGRRDQAGTIKMLRELYGAAVPEVVMPVAGEPVGDFEIFELFNTIGRTVADAAMLNDVDRSSNWSAALEDSVRDAWATELDDAIRNLERVRQVLRSPVRVCEWCGLRFTGRADARFCSDTHRVAAHRNGSRPT